MTDDYTTGEIKRGFDRLEKRLAELTLEVHTRHDNLSTQVAAATGPIPLLTNRMNRAEEDIRKLCEGSEDGKMQGARIYAVVGALVIVGNVVMWAVTTFWKH